MERDEHTKFSVSAEREAKLEAIKIAMIELAVQRMPDIRVVELASVCLGAAVSFFKAYRHSRSDFRKICAQAFDNISIPEEMKRSHDKFVEELLH